MFRLELVGTGAGTSKWIDYGQSFVLGTIFYPPQLERYACERISDSGGKLDDTNTTYRPPTLSQLKSLNRTGDESSPL